MVLIKRIDAQRTIDIGSAPSTRRDTSIGDGLQQLGGAVTRHGEMENAIAMRRMEMEKQDEDFAQNQALIRWNDDNSLEFAKLQQGIDVSGKGFTDSASNTFTKRAEEFLHNTPERLKPKFSELVATVRNQLVDKAAATEIDQRNNWKRTGIIERQKTLQSQVFNDPSIFNAAKEDVYRLIDSSGLPEDEAIALKKQTDETFSLTIGERDIRNAETNPKLADSAPGRLGVTGAVTTSRGGDAMSILRKFEGFRETPYWDVNADRVGYGSDTITTADGRVAKVQKGIKVSRADAERDLARRVKEFERGAVGQVGADQWNSLAPNVQAALVSVAYNYGSLPGNVAAAARTGDTGKIAASVEFRKHDNKGVNASRRTEEAAIIRGSMGISGNAPAFDPSSMDPRYADLTLQQRLTIHDQMNAAAKRGQTAIDAQTNAAYAAGNNSLLLGIQENKVTSVGQIYAAGLKDEDTLAALKALESRQGDQMAAAQTIQALGTGAWAGNAYDSKDKKNLDLAGAEIMKTVPAEQQQNIFESVTKQAGYVPEAYYNKVRAGLDSQVPAEVEAALQLASRLSSIDPSALGKSTGGSGVQDKVDLFNSYARMGYGTQEAAKRIVELGDPVKVQERNAIVKSEPIQKAIKKVSSSDVAKVFGSGWFSSVDVGGTATDDLIRVGATFESEAQIVADYKSILEDAFGEAKGNEVVARDLASTRMQKVYGLSETSYFGSSTVMRLPPEKTYTPLPDGSYGYIKDQLHEVLKDEGVDFDEAWLESYDKTDADHQAGNPANYQIIYSKNNKIGLYNLPFYADRNVALAKYNEEQQKLADDRSAVNQANKASELHRYPEGRDGPERFSNENLYRGIAREGSPMANAMKGEQQRKISSGEMQENHQSGADAMSDYLGGGSIPMGAGSAWGNPEAQQVGGTQGILKQQRKQLFQNAETDGTLPRKGR